MKQPIPEQPGTANSPTGPVLVRPYQIVISVSLLVGSTRSPRFPAILDPGHSHNFSIREDHWRDWVHSIPSSKGHIRVNGRPVPLVDADVEWESTRLYCPDGIAVFPVSHPSAPRLPLLGLRIIVKNGLTVVIDGAQKEVTIT